MSVDIWKSDYEVKEKRLLGGDRLVSRKLTPDEKEAVKILDRPEWKSLVNVVTSRAGKTKARIYREDLSGKELELGKLLGSLESLEWVIRLPDTLLHIHTKR
jgi:hypothetical protein